MNGPHGCTVSAVAHMQPTLTMCNGEEADTRVMIDNLGDTIYEERMVRILC